MSFRRVVGSTLAVACLWGATIAAAPAAAQTSPDTEFVRMMIPHHYQALVMSQMAPTRTNDRAVRSLASRIDVEQGLEIYMMQAWQSWNGQPVTNAQMAYQMMLQNPMMLEMMGMATPAELAQLSGSSGTAFDVLYLRLMIEHHEGAVRMLEDVLTNGSDWLLQFWATDMLVTQETQIFQMKALLAKKT